MSESTTPSPPAQSVIRLDSISKQFKMATRRRRFSMLGGFGGGIRGRKSFFALKDVDLDVQAGEMLGIIGMNGSGKSTLLKIIAGISPPSSGELEIDGKIGSLIELGAGFHPDLTGYENVYLNGSILGMRKPEIDDILPKVVEYAELEGFMNLPVKYFSSGMFVRLGFAIAIQTNPDILLLDETFAVGDLAFQARTIQNIQEFRRRGGTVIMVSHDVYSIRSYCDRVMWLDQGEMRMLGDPAEVTSRYIDYISELDEERAQEYFATHGDRLIGDESDAEGPVRIRDLRVLNGDGSPLSENPAEVAVEIELDCRDAVAMPEIRLVLFRKEDKLLVLEKSYGEELRDGETVRFVFDASRFYEDAFTCRVGLYDPENTDRLWHRREVDLQIDGIPQPVFEHARYLQAPCRELVHREDAH
ncbi:MAG: ABC transporter ATP-binding protein [Candidatus Sumerlaeia bacterium]